MFVHTEEVTPHAGMQAFGAVLSPAENEATDPGSKPGVAGQASPAPAPEATGVHRNNFVLQRREQLMRPRGTLASTTAKELPVNPAGFVALSGNDVQPTPLSHSGGQEHVRP